MMEKVKMKGQGQERTGSSCASLAGGTRSAFGCVGLSASARVASAKAEGRKTPKSALRLRLRTSTCIALALALALAAFAASGGVLRHGLALRGAAAGGGGGWNHPYVKRSLVAMWDAEHHGADGSKWVDCIGKRSMSAVGTPQWSAAYCAFDGTCHFTAVMDDIRTLFGGEAFTIELVAKPELYDGYLCGAVNMVGGYGNYIMGSMFFRRKYNTAAVIANPAGSANVYYDFSGNPDGMNVLTTYSTTYHCTYMNGSGEQRLSTRMSASGIVGQYIGKGASIGVWSNPFVGRIYCVRVYGDNLTPSEIQSNSEADRARFGGSE